MRHYVNTPASKRIIASLYVVWAFLLLVILGELAHCSTTQPRPNSLGVRQFYDSPYTYMVGSPAGVQGFEENGHSYTVVEFKTFGSAVISSQDILFCGNEEDSFPDRRLRAVIYRISPTRLYQGVGCHDLLRVLLIKEDQ